MNAKRLHVKEEKAPRDFLCDEGGPRVPGGRASPVKVS